MRFNDDGMQKAFKGLGHFLSDMVIRLFCAQTLVTPLVFAVMQHTKGKKAFFKKTKLKVKTLFFISCGGALK